MAERGIDLTLFSPRASAMGHHQGDGAVSAAGPQVMQRPHRPGGRAVSRTGSPASASCRSRPACRSPTAVAELRRCVEELGFVGCNLNPDPSGGHWTAPPLTDRSWYPLYEAMVELDVPAMVHVSARDQPELPRHRLALPQRGHHRVHAAAPGRPVHATSPTCGWSSRTAAARCPTTGAASAASPTCSTGRRWRTRCCGNVFFDTCVYHQPGIDLLFDVIRADNILFGSEMVGAVRGIDPRTGHHFDDTRRYVDALDLGPGDRAKVFEGNARRVYPRLARVLATPAHR